MLNDLVIVGGGLAASAALIALRGAGLRVAVVRPAAAANFKIGETLSPAANRELLALSVEPAELAEGCRPARSKFSSWAQGVLRETYEWRDGAQTGWCLDRLWFEDLLWSKATRTDFELTEDAVVGTSFENGQWTVSTRNGTTLYARRLLDASGRAGVVVRNQATRSRHDKLICRYEVLPQTDTSVEPTRATLIEPVADGWYYSVLLPGGQLLIAFFTDSDLVGAVDNWPARVAETEFTARRIATAGFRAVASPKVVDAATLVAELPPEGHLLAAGDAFACFDPLSSHGMTTALWAGRRTGAALAAPEAKIPGLLTDLWGEYQGGVDKYLREQARIYGLERRFGEELFWQRRHLAF